MLDQIRVAGVGDGLVDRIDQARCGRSASRTSNAPGVTSEPAASKNRLGLDGDPRLEKQHRFLVTVCHRGGLGWGGMVL